jgi:hypothetical protein
MVHENTYLINLPIDHLPEDTVLKTCFHDPVSNTIVLSERGFEIISEQEAREVIRQQVELQQSISSSETEKYNTLVEKLYTAFKDDPRIQEILEDEFISSDEFETINEMLNSANT